jgi:SAM-dependent methyltransferase
LSHDPRAWFDATAERMLRQRQHVDELEVVGDLDEFQRRKRRRVLDWLAARPLAGRRLLEIGCGAGGNLRFLKSLGAEVEGVDISPRMIELAGRLNAAAGADIPLQVVDGAHLPHADACFDIVLTVTALQHNLDGPVLESLIRDIGRVLVPGGQAWILEQVQTPRQAFATGVHRTRQEYVDLFAAAGCREREFWALHSHYPTWMARWQHLSTAAHRVLLRLGGREQHAEHDFMRRYGDGATLDSPASRGILRLSRLADRVHRSADALGFFVFETAARP